MKIILQNISLCIFFLLCIILTNGQYVQQGLKLVGSGAKGIGNQGFVVAVSADGNTLVEGGPVDSNQTGAVWVFVRSGNIWAQQSSKLIGTNAKGAAEQGFWAAVSSNGNTLIEGGQADSTNVGAAWIFTRTNDVWSQQGPKLVGTGYAGGAMQGSSVAISADGNTALIGGSTDNNNMGAAWVFTRINGVWFQQGTKLIGAGSNGGALQGISVSLSGDGNTALIGAANDSNGVGAAWIFTRINGAWIQQGPKLAGADVAGAANFGIGTSLSYDGNTAIVGGWADAQNLGASWVFTRTNGVWSQQGPKLVANDATAAAQQGTAVSLSYDGNIAMIGGIGDSSQEGASWIFTRANGIWSQEGKKLVGSGSAGAAQQGVSVALSANANTAVSGGFYDNNQLGATWVFVNPLLDSSALYVFNGNGNWSDPGNWINESVPPTILPNNSIIIINPVDTGACVLNIPVTIPITNTITISNGKKFLIPGNLILKK
jgi:hypothetical protein